MDARPNILWIVTTQWRAQACGYAGDTQAHTPHLDALAAQSVNYTQAVTPHPFGPFARAALLTGVPSPANGVRNYFDPLPPASRTIAHELRERGYATAFFGKWHLAARDPNVPLVGEAHARMVVPPEARGGFEYWAGFESGFQLNDPWLHGTNLPEPKRFVGYQPLVLADLFRDECTSGYLGRQPWFAVVSMEPPHPPYAAPADGRAGPAPDKIQLSANVPAAAAAQARTELAGYYAHITATDRAIGQLVADASAQGPTGRNANIVCTSVHGDMHGAHGLFRKGWPHEESVRVPLLVRESGVVPRRDASARSLVEMAAMTLAWAEQREVPAADSAGAQISMPSVVALPHQCDRAWRGVRTANRKLVLNADGSPWLLFDLATDPGEMRNLVGDPEWQAEIAALRARIVPE